MKKCSCFTQRASRLVVQLQFLADLVRERTRQTTRPNGNSCDTEIQLSIGAVNDGQLAITVSGRKS